MARIERRSLALWTLQFIGIAMLGVAADHGRIALYSLVAIVAIIAAIEIAIYIVKSQRHDDVPPSDLTEPLQ